MSTRETFRPLTDYEGLYEISDRGRVKSLARTVTQTTNGTTFTRFFKERFLKPTPNSHGYYQFKPCRNGKTITLKPMFKGGWTARDDFVRASPARYLMRHKPVMMRPLFQ